MRMDPDAGADRRRRRQRVGRAPPRAPAARVRRRALRRPHRPRDRARRARRRRSRRRTSSWRRSSRAIPVPAQFAGGHPGQAHLPGDPHRRQRGAGAARPRAAARVGRARARRQTRRDLLPLAGGPARQALPRRARARLHLPARPARLRAAAARPRASCCSRRAIAPTPGEVAHNPRAKSAHLRGARKLGGDRMTPPRAATPAGRRTSGPSTPASPRAEVRITASRRRDGRAARAAVRASAAAASPTHRLLPPPGRPVRLRRSRCFGPFRPRLGARRSLRRARTGLRPGGSGRAAAHAACRVRWAVAARRLPRWRCRSARRSRFPLRDGARAGHAAVAPGPAARRPRACMAARAAGPSPARPPDRRPRLDRAARDAARRDRDDAALAAEAERRHRPRGRAQRAAGAAQRDAAAVDLAAVRQRSGSSQRRRRWAT